MNRKIVFLLICLITIIVGILSFFDIQKPRREIKPNKNPMLQITSSQFTSASPIPKKFTCDGENINLPLTISDIPTGAKSLVLIVDDPDAPMGTWTHWLVWNIDPKTKEIQENTVPKGAIVGKNDFGKSNYGGPCPPSGTHRYFFKLSALDVILNLPQGSERRILENNMEGHILDKGELIGTYSR